MRVTPKRRPAFVAPVEKLLGQYVYVAGGRFHVLDDKTSENQWRLVIDGERHTATQDQSG
jgi:hypothetical protein